MHLFTHDLIWFLVLDTVSYCYMSERQEPLECYFYCLIFSSDSVDWELSLTDGRMIYNWLLCFGSTALVWGAILAWGWFGRQNLIYLCLTQILQRTEIGECVSLPYRLCPLLMYRHGRTHHPSFIFLKRSLTKHSEGASWIPRKPT